MPSSPEPGPDGGIAALLAQARARLPPRPGPEEAARQLARGALLIDIRPERNRREEGEIPGSIAVERTVFEWRLDPASDHRIAEVDEAFTRTERPAILVVCNEGYSSSLAAAMLQDLGWAGATDLEGGFRAWAAAGLPTTPGPSPSR